MGSRPAPSASTPSGCWVCPRSDVTNPTRELSPRNGVTQCDSVTVPSTWKPLLQRRRGRADGRRTDVSKAGEEDFTTQSLLVVLCRRKHPPSLITRPRYVTRNWESTWQLATTESGDYWPQLARTKKSECSQCGRSVAEQKKRETFRWSRIVMPDGSSCCWYKSDATGEDRIGRSSP